MPHDAAEPGTTRWNLFCEGDYIYSTSDPDDAASWVQADPAGHRAEATTPTTERRERLDGTGTA